MNKNKYSHPPPAEEKHPDTIGLERLIFFSDAVFAIAITLLVLEIRLPGGEIILNEEQLQAQLGGMWHKYLGYVISFMVIGVFWNAHHRKYRYIKRYDNGLILLNLLLLMGIGFIPFPSSLISEYPGPTATIFYAATMMFVSITMAVTWAYAAHGNRLIDPSLGKNRRRQEIIRPLMTGLVFLLSIGIAFINADLARLSWLLILPASMIARKDSEKQ